MDTVEAGGLSVAKALYDFMNDEALPETGLAVVPRGGGTATARGVSGRARWARVFTANTRDKGEVGEPVR